MGFIAFFFDMLHEMFTGGWLDIIIGIIAVAAVLVVIGIILWGLFYAIDSWFQPKKQAPGIIDGHDFTPAHTTLITVATSNGGTVIVPQYIPDSWSIGVRVGNRHSWMSCSKDCHDNYHYQQQVIATFKSGRLSGHMYVQAISPA